MAWKLDRPCSICNGNLPFPCLCCGWKRKREKPKLSAMEEAKQEGIKQRHKFLSRIGAGLQKYDMESTGSEQVDRAVREEITQFDIDEIRRDEETRKEMRD